MPGKAARNGKDGERPPVAGDVVTPQEPVDPLEALAAETRVLQAEARAERDVAPDVLTWLKACKAVLLAEGFRREIKQARKAGQVWGVIRQEPQDMQIHVRAFKDGRLESEVELSNRFIQHLWSHRRSAHPEVMGLLARHGLPTERVSETFVPITGSRPDKVMPTGRTRNHHVLLAVSLGLGLFVVRQYVKRLVLRRAGRAAPRVARRVLAAIKR